MSTADPIKWAKGKRRKVELHARTIGEATARALAVCAPDVAVCVALGFTANGDPYNTTGWRVGDETERQEAIRKGRRPFVKGDPRDPKSYGHIGSDDLHELSYYGVEGGYCPTPVATDPGCPWVVLARGEVVRKILGRRGVEGAEWYGADEDACAIGVANLARHSEAVRKRLPPALAWEVGDKPWDLWRWFATISSWSAGSGRADEHFTRYERELAALPPAQRVGAFLRLAGQVDDPGNRHKQDEHTALRGAQKLEAARLAVQHTGEAWALDWLDDGLGGDREAVYARLVATT